MAINNKLYQDEYMALANGDMEKYNEIKRLSVKDYLRKFEHHVKSIS